MSNEDKQVMIYYCKCGDVVECVSDPEFAIGDKDFKKAVKDGRKIETVTMSQFMGKRFLNCLNCHTQ